MSNMGTALETGGVDGTAEVVPSQDAQTIQSNPSEIKHTSSLETLMFLLLRDWIFLTRFLIDVKMNPGHVFGIIKIHPMFCHKYVRYVYQMFNAWTGSMAIRCRFMGTAFYGGSFRIGFLPPNLSEADIRGMGTENLTAYPNMDLDPKNTDWVHYSPPDERNVMFHWSTNTPTADKPETFGGYIVFYVVGPLVTQNPEFNSISLVVESVGKFKFAQPNPMFGQGIAPPINAGPLSVESCTDILKAEGCDDRMAGFGFLQYFNSSITSFAQGGVFSYGVGGKFTTEFPGNSIHATVLNYRNLVLAHGARLEPMQRSECKQDGTTSVNVGPYPGSDTRVPLNCNINAYCLTDTVFYPSGSAYAAGANAIDKKYFSPDYTTGLTLSYKPGTGYTFYPSLPAGTLSFSVVATNGSSSPISLAGMAIVGDTTLVTPSTTGESLVGFCTASIRSLNTQTRPMSEDMQANTSADTTTSFLYAVRTKTFTDPLRILRLNPNGMWTTSPFAADVVFDPQDETYLTYEGTWPVNTPLPPQSLVSQNYHQNLMLTSALKAK